MTDAVDLVDVKADVVGPDSYNMQANWRNSRRSWHSPRRNSGATYRARILFIEAIDREIEQGIRVIWVDPDDPKSKRLMLVGTGEIQAGIPTAETIVELVNGKDDTMIIATPGQLNLEQRLQSVKPASQSIWCKGHQDAPS